MGGAEEGPRPRRWDAVALVVLGAVILTGLVHYGRQLGDDDTQRDEHPRSHPSASPSASPPAGPSAGPSASSSAAPDAPASHPGTCWDGRATASLGLCGLPDGARGLAWVFPSFASTRESCRRGGPHGYPVAESYDCAQRAHGRRVRVVYDVLTDTQMVARWLIRQAGPGGRRVVPGAHGGRSVVEYDHRGQVRITGTYARFPYAATVIAADAGTARRAWQVLVRQRSPQSIRGVRSP